MKQAYNEISAMEPLVPRGQRERLSALSADIFREAGALGAEIPAAINREKIARLVREMNSYYSNLIEGHKTLPKDIEQAARQNFSADPAKRANQKLSLAHMEVDHLTGALVRTGQASPYAASFLCWLHEQFYRRLPLELHSGRTAAGESYPIDPGKLRAFNVTVGSHTPPDHSALVRFLDRFEQVYQDPRILATDRLVMLAAAHHRLAWIHPFGDGNGRVARLHSQAAMIEAGVDSFGLWTLSRGLARRRQDYYEALAGADQARRTDTDGRGNLTDRGLAAFCVFFLETALDQIKFMRGLLSYPSLDERMELYVLREEVALQHKAETVKILKELAWKGEITRTAVQGLISRGETVSRGVIKRAIEAELIESPSERGKISLKFPAKVLESYFPRLFIDLPAD